MRFSKISNDLKSTGIFTPSEDSLANLALIKFIFFSKSGTESVSISKVRSKSSKDLFISFFTPETSA